MRSARLILLAAAVCGLALLGLGALPDARSTPAAQCADSPVKPACKALVGGEAGPDLAPSPDMASEGPAISTEPVDVGVNDALG